MKHKIYTLLRYLGLLILSINVHGLLTWFFSLFIRYGFDIETQGKMNFSMLLIVLGCWYALGLLGILLICIFRKRLKPYFLVLLLGELLWLVLPILYDLIFQH